jgi:hypothetical protein
MKVNSAAAILAGVVSLAAAAGITYAILQPPEPQTSVTTAPDPSASPLTPAPGVKTSPTPVAIVPNRIPSVAPVSSVDSGIASEQAPDQALEPFPTQPVTRPVEVPRGLQLPPRSSSRAVETCAVSMAVVQDPNPPLNVRRAPSTDTEVVGTLTNGTWVMVEDEKQGWFRIASPIAGWVAKQRTDSTCNQKVERISLEGGAGQTIIADRFVGGGSHRYVLALQPGQRLTVTRTHGPSPSVTAPDGRVLADGPRDEPTSWSGRVNQAGNYTIALESNFKGYQYAFAVTVE